MIVSSYQAKVIGILLPFVLAGCGIGWSWLMEGASGVSLFTSLLVKIFVGQLLFLVTIFAIMDGLGRIFGQPIPQRAADIAADGSVRARRSPWRFDHLFWLECFETARAATVVAVLGAPAVFLHALNKPTALYPALEDTGDSLMFYFSFKVCIALMLADCYNYWKHRFLHSKSLFAFHRNHHAFKQPTVFSSFAIHPVEALLTFWPLLFFCAPQLRLWTSMHFSVLFLNAVLNAYLHCGHQFPWVERVLTTLFINTSLFHDVHHARTVTHFGEISSLWDHLMGTGEAKLASGARMNAVSLTSSFVFVSSVLFATNAAFSFFLYQSQ